VATELGIADYLDEGPKSSDELAELTGSHPSCVQQIMRALAGFGIFIRDDEGNYGLTAMAEPLVSKNGAWLRHYILVWGEQLYPACGCLLEMMRSGQVAYELAHGLSAYEHYKADKKSRDRFRSYMSAVTEWQNENVVRATDFSPYHYVVDVGGGCGDMLTHILQANPHLRGTILDQPHIQEQVSARIQAAELGNRCTFSGGNFLEEVVAGADLYIIKHVLHDWADRDVVTILRNISRAMPDGSTLIIIEAVMNDANCVDRIVKMRDVEQMISTGGKVRTREEFASLAGKAGLRLSEITCTQVVDVCLVKCYKSA
jgi:ubiquinone/menaquinone biosynthesis C-methylase UbiE